MSPEIKDDSDCFLTVSFHILLIRLCQVNKGTEVSTARRAASLARRKLTTSLPADVPVTQMGRLWIKDFPVATGEISKRKKLASCSSLNSDGCVVLARERLKLAGPTWQKSVHASRKQVQCPLFPTRAGRAYDGLPECRRSSGHWSAPSMSWPSRASSRWAARRSSACGGSTCCTPYGPEKQGYNAQKVRNEASAGRLRGGQSLDKLSESLTQYKAL